MIARRLLVLNLDACTYPSIGGDYFCQKHASTHKFEVILHIV